MILALCNKFLFTAPDAHLGFISPAAAAPNSADAALPLAARIAAPVSNLVSAPRVGAPPPSGDSVWLAPPCARAAKVVWAAGSTGVFGPAWHEFCRTGAVNPMLRLQSIGERCASSSFSSFSSVCAVFVAGKVDLPAAPVWFPDWKVLLDFNVRLALDFS